ncbi:hypothetical protein ACXC9Q_29855, partial [Kribbella sp. CWNU-51]
MISSSVKCSPLSQLSRLARLPECLRSQLTPAQGRKLFGDLVNKSRWVVVGLCGELLVRGHRRA